MSRKRITKKVGLIQNKHGRIVRKNQRYDYWGFNELGRKETRDRFWHLHKVIRPYYKSEIGIPLHKALSSKNKIKSFETIIIKQTVKDRKKLEKIIDFIKSNPKPSDLMKKINWFDTVEGSLCWEYFYKRMLKVEAGLWMGRKEMHRYSRAKRSKFHDVVYPSDVIDKVNEKERIARLDDQRQFNFLPMTKKEVKERIEAKKKKKKEEKFRNQLRNPYNL